LRKNIFVYLIITILLGSIIVNGANLTKNENEKTDIDNRLLVIQNAIIKNNANWVANYSSFIHSSKYIKNYIFNDEEVENEVELFNNLPDSLDWRDVDNTNWVTSVKNQANCGSCTAFGTLGALESVIQIELGQIINIDLSEAHLYYCNGGDCDSGIAISDAAQYVSSFGVSDEACFPYTTNDADCNDKAPNWKNRVVKAKIGTTKGVAGIKNAIYQYGPVVTSFDVYEDFDYYSDGIYEHVSGSKRGGHAVTIVGWNDDPGYWICKNSWGTGWGEKNPYSENIEKGYFRIIYNNCDIGRDTHFFHDFSGNLPPSKPINLKPYHDQQNVDVNINLSWTNSIDLDEDNFYYNLYFSEGRNVDYDDLIIENLNNNYYNVNNLKKGSDYSWFIEAEDEHGSQSISDEIMFTTRVPLAPVVVGLTEARVRTEITFTAYPSETGSGDKFYWEFDWDDDSNDVLGPFDECVEISTSHVWNKKGTYSITVRYSADNVWSDWGFLTVSMPKYTSINNINPLILRLIQRFPILESLF